MEAIHRDPFVSQLGILAKPTLSGAVRSYRESNVTRDCRPPAYGQVHRSRRSLLSASVVSLLFCRLQG